VVAHHDRGDVRVDLDRGCDIGRPRFDEPRVRGESGRHEISGAVVDHGHAPAEKVRELGNGPRIRSAA
jgi:hypothetical protein